MNTAIVKVLVSHPGRQHSHQAAMALQHAGLLAAYWSGVPSKRKDLWFLPMRVRRKLLRYTEVDVPREKTRWLPVATGLRRIGRVTPKALEQLIDFIACRAFDWQVAHDLRRAGANVVVACEISALSTFRAAKRLGMKTVLDAASVHYATQDRVTPISEAAWLHKHINDVKHAEIELADHILTVSELARRGYIEAGVPASRIHAVPLGADTQLFSPADGPATDVSEPCTFLFAGATIFRKGIDILLDALRMLEADLPGQARLVLVGPRGDAHALVEQTATGRVAVYPSMTQRELVDLYRNADCFVLPSRHDSFGMVVLEAMACGLPAIVTEMVGAREAIDDGKSGWVIPPGDAAALAARMKWCVANRPALAAMRETARAAAERYTWDSYARRLTQVLTRICTPPA